MAKAKLEEKGKKGGKVEKIITWIDFFKKKYHFFRLN
jgi:hypothetical protein